MEFFHLGDEYYAPVKYPEMFFKSIHDYCLFHRDRNPEGWDYFAGLYYQYLLNRHLDVLLKKEGLQEDVLYFVQTQPHFDPNPYYPVNTNQEEYPFGEEGFDEAYFLGDGYTGTVYANFILLEEPGKAIPPEKLQKVIEETQRLMGVPGRNERRKIHPIPGLRITEIHTYRLSAYDKAVVKDLFRRHPLTERADNPAPNFYTAFSDIYSVRTETEGFLYLDIFAEKIETKTE